MTKSEMIIEASGTIKAKVRSFFIKGRKIIPARIGVKLGGCGTILLNTSKEVKKIIPLKKLILLFYSTLGR